MPRKIRQILSEKLPFHLISPDLLSVFREQLSREINKLKWDTECSSLKPKKDILLNSFWGVKEPIMTPALSSEQKNKLQNDLRTLGHAFFIPRLLIVQKQSYIAICLKANMQKFLSL